MFAIVSSVSPGLAVLSGRRCCFFGGRSDVRNITVSCIKKARPQPVPMLLVKPLLQLSCCIHMDAGPGDCFLQNCQENVIFVNVLRDFVYLACQAVAVKL